MEALVEVRLHVNVLTRCSLRLVAAFDIYAVAVNRMRIHWMASN
jgi:hypothetical protein